MPGYEQHIRIERPADEVWAVLADLENAPAWMPGIEFIALDDDAPLADGSVYRFRVDGLRGELQKGTVTDCRPPRRLALSVARGRIDLHYVYTLKADGDATAVHLAAQCRVDGWLAPLAPLLIGFMRRSDAGLLEGLARAVLRGDKTRQIAPEGNQESPR